MRRFSVGLAILGAAVGLLAGAACDGGSTASGVVRIDSISPSSGTVRSEIVIHGSGFDSLHNDIGLTSPLTPESATFRTAFLSDISSPDGTTLRFELPDLLGACAMSQLGSNEGCPDVGLSLPIGEIDVAVHNASGTSQPVKFTRVPSALEAAQTAIGDSLEYDQLRQLAHDIMLDSFTLDSLDPSIGHYANSTRVDLRESETGEEAYIELEIKGSHVSALENKIPDEINGVEVRVVRDQ